MNPSLAAVTALRNLFDKAENHGYLHEVWMLVGAMRGPDTESWGTKRIYTTPVRSIFLTAQQADYLGLSDSPNELKDGSSGNIDPSTFYHPYRPFNLPVMKESYPVNISIHFLGHAYDARKVINNAAIAASIPNVPTVPSLSVRPDNWDGNVPSPIITPPQP